MSRMIISSSLENLSAHENPLLSLQDTVAFSSADWGEERDRAWIYGIVLGWDDDPDYPPELQVNAMEIVAKRCRWTPEQVARLRRLHEAFIALGGKPL